LQKCEEGKITLAFIFIKSHDTKSTTEYVMEVDPAEVALNKSVELVVEALKLRVDPEMLATFSDPEFNYIRNLAIEILNQADMDLEKLY